MIPESTGTDLGPDADQIRDFLDALYPGVYEIRIPSIEARRPRFFSTQHMYLKLPEDADVGVKLLATVTGRDAGAVYIVGNPVNPALLGRGRAGFYRAKSTASDKDVTHRRVMFIDIDADRPSAINADRAEIAQTIDSTNRAVQWLTDALGFPEPLFHGTSGSGGMILYRVDMPNDDEHAAKVQRALTALASEIDTDGVHVDTGVFNAARIFRVPGTVNAKSNTPQPDRPWTLVHGTINPGSEVVRV